MRDALDFAKGSNPHDRMAVLCLKERELNSNKGGFFTKQTMPGRQYQLLLENMKLPLSYVPLTSMILSEDSMLNFYLSQSSTCSKATLHFTLQIL